MGFAPPGCYVMYLTFHSARSVLSLSVVRLARRCSWRMDMMYVMLSYDNSHHRTVGLGKSKYDHFHYSHILTMRLSPASRSKKRTLPKNERFEANRSDGDRALRSCSLRNSCRKITSATLLKVNI